LEVIFDHEGEHIDGVVISKKKIECYDYVAGVAFPSTFQTEAEYAGEGRTSKNYPVPTGEKISQKRNNEEENFGSQSGGTSLYGTANKANQITSFSPTERGGSRKKKGRNLKLE